MYIIELWLPVIKSKTYGAKEEQKHRHGSKNWCSRCEVLFTHVMGHHSSYMKRSNSFSDTSWLSKANHIAFTVFSVQFFSSSFVYLYLRLFTIPKKLNFFSSLIRFASENLKLKIQQITTKTKVSYLLYVYVNMWRKPCVLLTCYHTTRFMLRICLIYKKNLLVANGDVLKSNDTLEFLGIFRKHVQNKDKTADCRR